MTFLVYTNWMARPSAACPGPLHPPHPLCTPLTTTKNLKNRLMGNKGLLILDKQNVISRCKI